MNQISHIKDAKSYIAFRGNWRRSWKVEVEQIKALRTISRNPKLREWQRRAAQAELRHHSTIARSLMIAREQVEYDKAQRMLTLPPKVKATVEPAKVPAT